MGLGSFLEDVVEGIGGFVGQFVQPAWEAAGDIQELLTGERGEYSDVVQRPYRPLPMTRAEMDRRRAAQEIYSTDDVMIREGISQGYLRFGPSRRRMNVLNPRALNRSIRRAKGFMKYARRVGSFMAPGRSYKLKAQGHRVSHRVKHR